MGYRNDLNHIARIVLFLNLFYRNESPTYISNIPTMMNIKRRRNEPKYFFINSYQYLWQLEQAIKMIRTNASDELQLSVLGQLEVVCISNTKELMKSKKALKIYWKGSLGANSHFGLFCNPEIGTLFIAGTLVSQFLNTLDGRFLGEITSGLFGILRGLGIEESKVTWHLNALIQGHFVLLVRGYDFQLDRMVALIEPLG
jgi:hypothetical protein